MKVIDAQKELDALLPHCSDVENFVGFTLIPNNQGRPGRVAFARLIFKKDGPLRELPSKLVYRKAVEAGTGLEMFILSAPGEALMMPLLATEWTDSCSDFAEGVEVTGIFIVEMLTPSRCRRALVVKGEVQSSAEFPLTPEEYERICNAFSPPPGDRTEPS